MQSQQTINKQLIYTITILLKPIKNIYLKEIQKIQKYIPKRTMHPTLYILGVGGKTELTFQLGRDGTLILGQSKF